MLIFFFFAEKRALLRASPEISQRKNQEMPKNQESDFFVFVASFEQWEKAREDIFGGVNIEQVMPKKEQLREKWRDTVISHNSR